MIKVIYGIVAFILTAATIALGSNGESGITGRVLLGPVCPVVQSAMEDQCQDRPFRTTLVVTESDTGREIAKFDSDEHGAFRVIAPPGNYTIASLGDVPYPRCREIVTVTTDTFTDVSVQCDTGIR